MATCTKHNVLQRELQQTASLDIISQKHKQYIAAVKSVSCAHTLLIFEYVRVYAQQQQAFSSRLKATLLEARSTPLVCASDTCSPKSL